MDVTFALPNVTADGMNVEEQSYPLRMQALSVIISAYLDHAARVNQDNPSPDYRFTGAELVTLINNVQGALSSDR